MKIKMFGTGSLPAKSFSSCFLVDDSILVDCPNGLMKKLRNADVDFHKIKIILITHFHGDHDFDMPFLLREYNKFAKRKETLTLIAPKNAVSRYKILYEMCLPETFDTIHENAKLKVIEINEKVLSREINIDEYKINIYKVEHGCDAYAYKISKDNKSVAFTGDTTLCDNVYKLLEGIDIAFVDVTLPETVSVHMGIADIEKLRQKFHNCKFVPTHMHDHAREKLKDAGFNVPSDDDVFTL